jgi:hypothetical protein
MEMKECAICYEVIGKTNACVTPCGHEFCFKCMVKSFQTNDSCPMCRANYLEKDECLHSDSEDEEDDDETLYDSDEEYVTSSVSYLNNITEKIIFATPEQISKNLQKQGYTMEDIVSLLTNRVNRENERYSQSFICRLIKDVDDITTKCDDEKERIINERKMMSLEDTRIKEIEEGYVFDSLRILFGE